MASQGYNPMFTNMPSEAQSIPLAEERLERIKAIQEEIQSAMVIAQEKQKWYYDEHRQNEPEYQVGDKVWLSAENITTNWPSTKLVVKRLGPYKVKAKISSHTY